MPTNQLLMIILIPIGTCLLVVFLIYILGNVYNGLITRREKVNHSWYELTKSLLKSFEYIPTLLQEVEMDSKLTQSFQDIYRQYSQMDIKKASPSEVCKLDCFYQECLNKLTSKGNKKGEVIDFILELRRLTAFSVPLYNTNVKDYLKFKNLFINRTFAKAFNFADAEYFKVNQQQGDTTTNFKVQKK